MLGRRDRSPKQMSERLRFMIIAIILMVALTWLDMKYGWGNIFGGF